MHAIAFTYTLLLRCERPLGAAPMPSRGTQHESGMVHDSLATCGCIRATNITRSSINVACSHDVRRLTHHRCHEDTCTLGRCGICGM